MELQSLEVFLSLWSAVSNGKLKHQKKLEFGRSKDYSGKENVQKQFASCL